MFVESNAPYKSIEILQPPFGLPDFVVLSGLNGGGKTQLLTGISEGQIIVSEPGKQLAPIKFITHETFGPNPSGGASRESIRNLSRELINMRRRMHQFPPNDPSVLQQRRVLEIVAMKAKKPVEALSDEDVFLHYPLEFAFRPIDVFQQNLSALFKGYQIRKFQN